jgi:hypothetical protein
MRPVLNNLNADLAGPPSLGWDASLPVVVENPFKGNL